MHRIMFSCALAALSIFLGMGCIVRTKPSLEPAADNADQLQGAITECRVQLGIPSDRVNLELTITDRELIRRLIESPLELANENAHPARYVVIGTVEIRRRDGTKDRIALFEPWGHFKHGEKYMTTDFCELKKAFKVAVAETAVYLDEGDR